MAKIWDDLLPKKLKTLWNWTKAIFLGGLIDCFFSFLDWLVFYIHKQKDSNHSNHEN